MSDLDDVRNDPDVVRALAIYGDWLAPYPHGLIVQAMHNVLTRTGDLPSPEDARVECERIIEEDFMGGAGLRDSDRLRFLGDGDFMRITGLLAARESQ